MGAQVHAASLPAGNATADAATLQQLTALRDDFIGRIKSQGLAPRLAPPAIQMDNPPSFGNYENDTNVLHTGNWRTLPPALQEVFSHQAQAAANGKSGEWMFEQAAHRWIFVHELGHWWRTCQNQKADPYQDEAAANRIALAYWRERDPDLVAYTLMKFRRYVDDIPNPVPPGQSKETYLNEHYDSLGGQRAYTWYQAGMVLDVAGESPNLTFHEAITWAGKKP